MWIPEQQAEGDNMKSTLIRVKAKMIFESLKGIVFIDIYLPRK
jgi:hypothetical protein